MLFHTLKEVLLVFQVFRRELLYFEGKFSHFPAIYYFLKFTIKDFAGKCDQIGRKLTSNIFASKKVLASSHLNLCKTDNHIFIRQLPRICPMPKVEPIRTHFFKPPECQVIKTSEEATRCALWKKLFLNISQ